MTKSGFDFELRGCLFKDERKSGDTTLFRAYTQRSCKAECALSTLWNNASVQCFPWDLPFPPQKSKRERNICSRSESTDFKERLTELSFLNLCQCPRECNQVEYDIEVQFELKFLSYSPKFFFASEKVNTPVWGTRMQGEEHF